MRILKQTRFPVLSVSVPDSHSVSNATRLDDQESAVVREAIRVAHRLVFAEKSLDVLKRGILSVQGQRGPTLTEDDIEARLKAVMEHDEMELIIDKAMGNEGIEGDVAASRPEEIRIAHNLVSSAAEIRAFDHRYLCSVAHLFHLAVVISHMMVHSIQMRLLTPNTIQEVEAECDRFAWWWEQERLGGIITRNLVDESGIGIEKCVKNQINSLECILRIGSGQNDFGGKYPRFGIMPAEYEWIASGKKDWESLLPFVPSERNPVTTSPWRPPPICTRPRRPTTEWTLRPDNIILRRCGCGYGTNSDKISP